MELFLNILWVFIALACLFVWRSRWAMQPREREHASWRQWTAFVCALILLFFMVSLTDDLHSELVVFEECSASRRHAACLARPHHAPQSHAAGSVYATLTTPSFTYALAQIGLVTPELDHSRLDFHVGRTSGRAPPVISL
jgi:hypothetical protein